MGTVGVKSNVYDLRPRHMRSEPGETSGAAEFAHGPATTADSIKSEIDDGGYSADALKALCRFQPSKSLTHATSTTSCAPLSPACLPGVTGRERGTSVIKGGGKPTQVPKTSRLALIRTPRLAARVALQECLVSVASPQSHHLQLSLHSHASMQ